MRVGGKGTWYYIGESEIEDDRDRMPALSIISNVNCLRSMLEISFFFFL